MGRSDCALTMSVSAIALQDPFAHQRRECVEVTHDRLTRALVIYIPRVELSSGEQRALLCLHSHERWKVLE